MNELLLDENWVQVATALANVVISPKSQCLIFIGTAAPAAGSQIGMTLTWDSPLTASNFSSRTVWARTCPGQRPSKIVVAAW